MSAEWFPIDTAPLDGTRVRLMNADTGLRDIGSWCDYSDRPEGQRTDWPEWLKRAGGEWDQDEGNGPMTHWQPID